MVVNQRGWDEDVNEMIVLFGRCFRRLCEYTLLILHLLSLQTFFLPRDALMKLDYEVRPTFTDLFAPERIHSINGNPPQHAGTGTTFHMRLAISYPGPGAEKGSLN